MGLSSSTIFSPKKGLLRLAVRCEATRPGDDLGVKGEAPAMPGWDRGAQALLLSCIDPITRKDTWPVWTLSDPLEVELGQELQYKYVIIRGTRRDKLRWETDGEMLLSGTWDDGQFGHVPGQPPREHARTRRVIQEEDVPGCDTVGAILPPMERKRQIGKGKQGACYLVDFAGTPAVLKELKGGRSAFKAELRALQLLQDASAVIRGTIPALLGFDTPTQPEQERAQYARVDVSLCFSFVLALLWQQGRAVEETLSSRPVLEQVLFSTCNKYDGVLSFRGWTNQVLPSVLVVQAARSVAVVMYAGFTLGLHAEGGGWLGDSPGSGACVAVHCAVLIWRAEKVETLLQRMQRSANVVKDTGLGGCIKNGFAEPWDWLWPGLWGSFRRFALVGYGSFVRAALPAVVFDECLWWIVIKCQDAFARKVCALPMTLDLVILPFIDFLHMVPVITKVLLLGVLEYPQNTEYPALLILCAMAWTGHNCHMAYTQLFVDLPEQARQLWASGYFPGVKLPDTGLAPAFPSAPLRRRATHAWLDMAEAVEEANRRGVIHCDVNPWNVLCKEELPEPAGAADSPQACLVDWACSALAEGGSAPKLQRRGDFQAAELVEGRFGPRSDVFGCAATLLWLLLKRTRKGLPDRTPELLQVQLQEAAGEELPEPFLEGLGSAISWAMAERWEDRCPDVATLVSRASCYSRISALKQIAEAEDAREAWWETFAALYIDIEARPMVLSFAPGWWGPPEMGLLNDFRMAMDELLASPEQETADYAKEAYDNLMLAISQQQRQWAGTKDANAFFPDADYDIRARGDPRTEARLVPPPCGCLELYEVGGEHAHPHRHARPSGFTLESQGEQATFQASPAWLRSLSALARRDLEGDLDILAAKFDLTSARLSEVRKHGLPAGLAIDIAGAACAVEAARRELVEGILQYYGTQVEWSAAELPTEPDEEPPSRENAKRVWVGAPTHRARPVGETAVAEPAPELEEDAESGGMWGDAPQATEVAWGAPEPVQEVSWGSGAGGESEAVPGLLQALHSVGLENEAAQIAHWAEENGAVSVQEVAENANLFVEELGLDWSIADRMQGLR
eukprot:s675_g14.t1